MFYREDFSVSFDQDHPLDTSFTDLHITIDDSSSTCASDLNSNHPQVEPPSPQPATPQLVQEANTDDDNMPYLSIRDDISTVVSAT